MPEQSAATVAHLLPTVVISRSGVPLQIHTDQGRNLEYTLTYIISPKLHESEA